LDKGVENRLAIRGDGRIVLRAELFDGCLSEAGVEQRLRKSWAQRPQSAGPGKPTGDGGTLEAAAGAQGDGWIIRRSRHADESVGLFHLALSGRDIRATLQELRGNTEWHGRGRGFHRLRRYRECGWRLSDNNGDGVLELSPHNAKVGALRADGVELVFGLGDSFFGIDTGFVEGLGQLERLFESDDVRVENFFQRILATELVVVEGKVGLCGEAGGFEVRCGQCVGGGIGTNGIANAAPEVGSPAGVKRERKFSKGTAGGRSCRLDRGRRLVEPFNSRAQCDRREVLRTCLTNDGASGHKVGVRSRY